MDIMLVLSRREKAGFECIRKDTPGVAGTVLSRKLRFLEDKKLIARRLVDARPPRTTYQLTSKGVVVVNLARPLLLYLRYLESLGQDC